MSADPIQQERLTVKQRLEALRAELAAAEEFNRVQDAAMSSDPTVATLGKEKLDAEAKRASAAKSFEVVMSNARQRVLTDTSMMPDFRRNSAWGRGTNIRDDVLAVIKEHVKISLLSDGDVQEIAANLIKMFAESDPAYAAAKSAYDDATTKESAASSRFFDYTRKYEHRGTYNIQHGIRKLERIASDEKAMAAAEKRINEKNSVPEKTRVIFEALKAAAAPSAGLKVGDSVSFHHRGMRLHGVVTGFEDLHGAPAADLTVDGSEGEWVVELDKLSGDEAAARPPSSSQAPASSDKEGVQAA